MYVAATTWLFVAPGLVDAQLFLDVKNFMYVGLCLVGIWACRKTIVHGWREMRARPVAAGAWVIGGLVLSGLASGLYGIALLITGKSMNGENQAAIDAELLDVSASLPASLYFLGVVGVFAPVVEELVFREIPLGTLQHKLSTPLAFALSSITFGVLHLRGVHEWPLAVYYIGSGAALAIAYLKSNRNILVPIAAHMLWNGIGTAFQLLTTVLR
ncbi:type II CAAX endopeptidase family protein [Leucobacter sp. NPDC077196]|uniref:CPBP family intramembrane glutamic endopeptidase n=1 Tax=Leucobacter sp. NPDC077196 TaxID=3154959 RepID=UPI003415E9BF